MALTVTHRYAKENYWFVEGGGGGGTLLDPGGGLGTVLCGGPSGKRTANPALASFVSPALALATLMFWAVSTIHAPFVNGSSYALPLAFVPFR